METSNVENESLSGSAPSRRRRWKAGTNLGAAAIAGLLAVTGLAAAASAGVFSSESDPPESLQNAVDEVFSGGECVSEPSARDELEAALIEAGYGDWSVESRPGAQRSPCVAPGIMLAVDVVALVPVAGSDVTSTLLGVAGDLMAECLDLREAENLLASTLRAVDIESFHVSTDGPVAYPSDQREAVMDHIDGGCVVYSGTGADPEGVLTVYLSGA